MEPTLVSTKMAWEDLVLSPKTLKSLEAIELWQRHNEYLMQEWGLQKRVKPGFRALFYGPSGTGKTVTAALLGAKLEKAVYRIDLSQIVSKYIGETEKNLQQVFTAAEGKDWILFFDEADALFGKRTSVSDAHDRYANMETQYLLQRIENYPGLVMVAAINKSHLDEAFTRRFNIHIPFPMPDQKERELIWKTSIPEKASFSKEVNLGKIAGKYELTGAAITNVIHYASLKALAKNSNSLTKADILQGIQHEYEKEERVFE